MNRHLGISVDNMDLDFIINNNIHWIQLSSKFSGASDIASLLRLTKKHPIKISYVSPVFHQNDPNMVFFLSPIKRLRDATMEILEVNLRMAKSLPTEHVVVNLAPDPSQEIDKSLIFDTIYDLNDLSHRYDAHIVIQIEDYSLFGDSTRLINIINKTDVRLSLDINRFYRYIFENDMDFEKELQKIIDYVEVINITFDIDYFILQNVLTNMYDKIMDIPIIIRMRSTSKKREIYNNIKNIREDIVKKRAAN
ncbi:hypothetical protein GOQ27_05355 [Clostridium sp. D2Q-11]|uniref:Uncharacterized protein n=1 Tax=Anaeromonas frigoriresistens TaxID=2683708 RepID=A0A942Z833_9FIRM|nr:hypothetical protein [Anaeromonas frigoriresistens]MBS4537878.1 hypothetical protein [Anaeromonas frigoriresistens]